MEENKEIMREIALWGAHTMVAPKINNVIATHVKQKYGSQAYDIYRTAATCTSVISGLYRAYTIGKLRKAFSRAYSQS